MTTLYRVSGSSGIYREPHKIIKITKKTIVVQWVGCPETRNLKRDEFFENEIDAKFQLLSNLKQHQTDIKKLVIAYDKQLSDIEIDIEKLSEELMVDDE